MGFLRRVYTHEDRDFTAVVGTDGVVGAKVVRATGANGIKPIVRQGTSAGVKGFGVAEYDAPVNADVNVVKGGVVRLEAGGAVTAFGLVRGDSDGNVVNVAGDGSEAALAIGRAWTGGSDGDEVIVDLDDEA